MKVILLQNVPKIGQKGDVKDLKEGYVRNMLLPKNLAKIATAGDIKSLQKSAEMKDKNHDALLEKASRIFEKLNSTKIKISEKANEKGHLFAQVGVGEIVAAVREQIGEQGLDQNWIKMSDHIKEVGEHKITCQFENIKSSFILEVVEM